MDIINVTTTKSAISTTENGVFNLEYNISNNKLGRVNMNIYAIQTNPEKEDVYMGQICLENDLLSASFVGNVPTSKLMSDYEAILQQIKKDVSGK